MNTKSAVEANIVFSGYLPGSLATLCAMQSRYYAKTLGFDHIYESVVAGGVAEFLQRYDPSRDFVQLIVRDGDVQGGIAIDSRDGLLAQLRWFIVDESLRGLGIGKKLITDAMNFCIEKQFPRVYLTTIEGLDIARQLYDSAGFKLEHEAVDSSWGKPVKEQRLLWTLPDR